LSKKIKKQVVFLERLILLAEMEIIKYKCVRSFFMQPIYIKQESLTSKQYLDLSKTESNNIESVSIVYPKLGGKGFATFLITYKFPKVKPYVKSKFATA
jgi:hypothetical protein